MDTVEMTTVLEGRTIMYDVTGDGPPVVFVHGVWATGGVWYPVIDALSSRFRCINVHLPLGVHRYPSPKDVDHSIAALARVIAALMEMLDLHDVTLVGNDTGGAICQVVLANHRERIGRVVLTNCDAFETFPPSSLAALYSAARFPAVWWAFAQLGRVPMFRKRFSASVSRTSPDDELVKMLMLRFASNPAVREDLRLTICSITPKITLEAATTFASFERDVLVLWATDDVFFPVSLGRRLADAFPNAKLQLVENAKLFIGIDAPHETADAIAAFARATCDRVA